MKRQNMDTGVANNTAPPSKQHVQANTLHTELFYISGGLISGAGNFYRGCNTGGKFFCDNCLSIVWPEDL